VPQYFPQTYAMDFVHRYGPPPQPMRTMANASPPSPPFYYQNTPMVGFMPNTSSPNRGEYIFQHNLAATGPYAQYTLNNLQTPPNRAQHLSMESRHR
jgi:hypothetical protein